VSSDCIHAAIDQSMGSPVCYLLQFRHRSGLSAPGLDGILPLLQARTAFRELILATGILAGQNRV
jgi:hypothetical protein